GIVEARIGDLGGDPKLVRVLLGGLEPLLEGPPGVGVRGDAHQAVHGEAWDLATHLAKPQAQERLYPETLRVADIEEIELRSPLQVGDVPEVRGVDPRTFEVDLERLGRPQSRHGLEPDLRLFAVGLVLGRGEARDEAPDATRDMGVDGPI